MKLRKKPAAPPTIESVSQAMLAQAAERLELARLALAARPWTRRQREAAFRHLAGVTAICETVKLGLRI